MGSSDRYVDPERESFEAFKLLPRDSHIEMLNLIRYREYASYPSDHPLALERISGAEAYRNYSSQSAPVFARVGGTIVWSAVPEVVLIGPEDELWNAAFIARYPSASSFLEMVTDDSYRLAVIHRQAAVETSRLIRTTPHRSAGTTGFG